jgi:hypothetical protein
MPIRWLNQKVRIWKRKEKNQGIPNANLRRQISIYPRSYFHLNGGLHLKGDSGLANAVIKKKIDFVWKLSEKLETGLA